MLIDAAATDCFVRRPRFHPAAHVRILPRYKDDVRKAVPSKERRLIAMAIREDELRSQFVSGR